MLWLCCATSGRIALARTELVSGSARTFPLQGSIVDAAADAQAVYLLGADGRIYVHKPWR